MGSWERVDSFHMDYPERNDEDYWTCFYVYLAGLFYLRELTLDVDELGTDEVIDELREATDGMTFLRKLSFQTHCVRETRWTSQSPSCARILQFCHFDSKSAT